MSFQQAMEQVARFFEAIGALVLVAGLVVSVVLAVRSWRHDRLGARAWQVLRNSFGSVILLGLEILVAADLLRTVAVAPTVENVLVLGAIVLIRTVLSFSLEIEIEGVAPWRRAQLRGPRRAVGLEAAPEVSSAEGEAPPG
jgi:uncharacterized membrane protein